MIGINRKPAYTVADEAGEPFFLSLHGRGKRKKGDEAAFLFDSHMNNPYNQSRCVVVAVLPLWYVCAGASPKPNPKSTRAVPGPTLPFPARVLMWHSCLLMTQPQALQRQPAELAHFIHSVRTPPLAPCGCAGLLLLI